METAPSSQEQGGPGRVKALEERPHVHRGPVDSQLRPVVPGPETAGANAASHGRGGHRSADCHLEDRSTGGSE